MEITPTVAASRRSLSWGSIMSAACAKAARRKTTPARDVSPPRSSSTMPSTTTMFVRATSTCATKAGTNTSRENFFYRYEALASDCQNCPLKPQCCPGNQYRGRGLLRTEETAAMVAFRQKMATPEAQKQYRRRRRVIEFCHAWIKSKLGLRQFHLRGLAKVQMEMLWACLTYNLQRWIRLRKLQAATA